MKISKVCCQGCGADLQIDETIRFVTCNHCGTQLEVVHDETVTHTKQLDRIARTTDQLAGNLKVIELQNDLARIDREWESLRNGLLIRGKDGNISEPSSVGSIVGGVVMVVFGIIWIGAASGMGAPGVFPLVGLAIIGIAVYTMIRGTFKAGNFQRLQAAHQGRRSSLIAKINAARRD